ncbi:MAG: formylglycine-generating enzyme family protein, partial [Candidatus Electryonea clarkiae]|nr:formylglycine-generating enzyme family protein [Candidatus Electryonea clarkiae]
DNPFDPDNPFASPEITGIETDNANEFINDTTINVRITSRACSHLQISVVENFGDEPSGEWFPAQDTTIIALSFQSDAEGIRYLACRGKSTHTISDVSHYQLKLDRSVEIDTFYWITDGGDTLLPGDQITFALMFVDDAFGTETGGIGIITVQGWETIELTGEGDGCYMAEITVQTNHPQVRNSSVTASFTDRAGNRPTIATAQGTITCNFYPAGYSQLFDLGSSGTQIFMVWIPQGTFMMGTQFGEEEASSNEFPRHEVIISKGFWMGKYEVTQEKWEAVVDTSPFFYDNNPNYPAESVSWNDIHIEFLDELNNHETDNPWRLPTEAEWEYACRAGHDDTWFWWGSSYDHLWKYAWFSSNSSLQTHNVGGKIPNPWGLYDMHGNVFEWCEDWYDSDYYSSPTIDPQGPSSGTYRVLRGGSYDRNSWHCRSKSRFVALPDTRSVLGFRVIRSSLSP